MTIKGKSYQKQVSKQGEMTENKEVCSLYRIILSSLQQCNRFNWYYIMPTSNSCLVSANALLFCCLSQKIHAQGKILKQASTNRIIWHHKAWRSDSAVGTPKGILNGCNPYLSERIILSNFSNCNTLGTT